MEKIKVSCVSYLNSRPFIFGLENSEIKNEIELSLDVPSVCAQKLETGVVDIGLVPAVVLDEMDDYHIISDYCIGADGEVGSVLLVSDVPLKEIKNILLDYESRTSVMLAQVLAKKFWKINPQWIDAKKNYEGIISNDTAGIVIGDRSFAVKNKFKYVYDLGAEWKHFTNLPFVFACWISNKELDRNFVKRFNEALRFGLLNSEEVIREYKNETGAEIDVKDYLSTKISYGFDKKKQFALELFLEYIHKLGSVDSEKKIADLTASLS
jgi:chorismate dehydratase